MALLVLVFAARPAIYFMHWGDADVGSNFCVITPILTSQKLQRREPCPFFAPHVAKDCARSSRPRVEEIAREQTLVRRLQ
jgi:hypothetical protein